MERPLPREEEEEPESLIDRSVTFLRELSGRLRDQAGRKWHETSVNLDIGMLRRRRRQWVAALGEAVYAMMKRGGVDADALQEYFDELRSIERRIEEREAALAELEDEREAAAAEEPPLDPAPVLPRRRGRRAAAARRREEGEPGLPGERPDRLE